MAATPALLRILACAHSASIRAGKVVRDVMEKGDLGIIEKGKNDLQTLADRTAQQCIIGAVRHSFPLATIIGEEGCMMGKDDVATEWKESLDPHAEILAAKCPAEYVDFKEEQFTIWVDPLDGTKEYTEGLVDHVTVLIGLAVDERPIAGIIHQPFFSNEDSKGRTIWGIKGVGAGGPINIAPPDSNKFVITTSRSHLTPEIESAVKSLNPDEIIRVGGAGFKVLMLLEGKAHAYVFPSAGCKRWDTCAPEAILTAVGGILSGMDGNLYSYHRDCNPINDRGVLAARLPQFHDRVVQALKSAKSSE